ncbi:methyltransferase family protein [Sedimentitalea todarodis]|uniref:Isoprenylcysteine carboxylmethyltransferase family protein n=1 Tax=Sedimentitalea todarodis TaxID=1631240 RepID=A0ABU3VL75_9RHOB|nr:isoprenylcysteine carboxylmethyltransferase family protein [Sedimentitalea todarodis]MDU9006915.1 isoprenylcysteine carboxylmethyltransferase family protein [Sedimentitalea todarodis]
MRYLVFVYALLSYALFGIVFVWMAAFLHNFGDLRGPATRPAMDAALINLALILLFGVVHSVMARPAFKRIWTRVIPPAAERATYVLQSSLLLGLIIWQWQPIPAVIWQVEGTAAWVFYAVSTLGAVIILVATFLLGHFEFVGLSQAWHSLRGTPTPPATFRTPMLYRIVRHPLQFGLLIMMVATPVMTLGHLIFVAAMAVYIAIGLRFEERALLREFGAAYAAYQRDVPMLIPNPFRLSRGSAHGAP